MEVEFEQELRNAYIEAKRKCKYNPTRFIQMLGEYGAVETAVMLLSTGGTVQTGLHELYICERLDLSVEAKVLMRKYAPLFSPSVKDIAEKRLRERNFDVEAWQSR